MAVRIRLSLGFVSALALGWLALGCTETPYSFFPLGPPAAGVGGGVGTGGGAGSGGEVAASGGTGAVDSGGSLGQGGEAPMDDCTSVVDTSRTAVLLRTAGGLCVSAGSYAPLLGEVSFAVVLQECTGRLAQRWTIEEMEYGAKVFVNEAVVLNLDVQFAASDDGTPAVLYTRHRLYNQRFVELSQGDGTFKLSPLHTPDKCMSERAAGLQLWPCDEASTTQTFEVAACDAVTADP